MGIVLPPVIRVALMDPRAVKILSTVNKFGDAHLSFKQSLRVREDYFLEYDEISENSLTNQNMFYAIWANKIIVLNIHTLDRRAFKLAARPKRAIISGQDFKDRYLGIRKKGSEACLATVWVIEPLSFAETTQERRVTETVFREPIRFRPGRLRAN
jgi:hypothetical protein